MLGGTSWISTIEYYKKINMMISEAKGNFNSAKISMHSINYAPIKSQYNDLSSNNIQELLWNEILELMKSAPDCLILCNNFLHTFSHKIVFWYWIIFC